MRVSSFRSTHLINCKALRLVLHTISTSAARYGKYIKPILSLSIDFYVRLFVQIYSAPIEVKKVFRCVQNNVHLYYSAHHKIVKPRCIMSAPVVSRFMNKL